jgi:hypothetical protein
MTSVYVFVTPTESGVAESHIWEAAKRNPNILRPQGTPNVRGALKRPIGNDPGKWTTQTWEVADGTILKLFAAQDRGVFGAAKTTASQYVRVRQTAPLWRIRVKLLDRVETNVPFLDITGRFDLLTAADLKQSGIAIHPAFTRQLNETEHVKLFEKSKLEDGTAAKEISVIREVNVSGAPPVEVAIPEARRVNKF